MAVLLVVGGLLMIMMLRYNSATTSGSVFVDPVQKECRGNWQRRGGHEGQATHFISPQPATKRHLPYQALSRLSIRDISYTISKIGAVMTMDARIINRVVLATITRALLFTQTIRTSKSAARKGLSFRWELEHAHCLSRK